MSEPQPSAGGAPTGPAAGQRSTAPGRPALVLLALILVAAVANLNLAVANVALPSIGKAFDSSQTALNLIAVGYSLGLAASVLYLGAIGDRYGRKLLLLLGIALSVPACLLAAYAPTDRSSSSPASSAACRRAWRTPPRSLSSPRCGPGPARTSSIALWSALGGAISALGPLISGILLEHFWWGSVFLVTLPLAVVALVLAWLFVPAHVNEATEPVDNLGGVLSVAARRLRSSWPSTSRPCPNEGALVISLAVIALAARRRVRAAAASAPRNPLYDLHIAGRRVFWVAACAGIIVFGSLMGAMFIGQQFLQNVLGYSTARGRRVDPARGLPDGARGAAIGEARRVARRPRSRCSSATCSASSASSRCCCCGRRTSRTGGSGWRTPGRALGSGSRARPRRTR